MMNNDGKIIDETVVSWTAKVRDYEIDGYGGVNASTYLNYMEEARKEYLALLKLDLAALAKRNIGFVVARYEVDYRRSLFSGEEFVVETQMKRVSRLKVIFNQSIYRLQDRALIVKCKNEGVAINIATLRPEWPNELNVLLADFPIQSN
jgi:acyl-CoA thioester hydrolase